ncbi:MAG: hypothetical protein IPK93_07020 [Solirubrobacterales bacterium]|nr:hypothetical protein [Solirubrobacterales bacterium]
MKRLIGTITVLVLLVVVPSSAIAHQGNPNFRSEITSITPAAAGDGLKVQIENFDDNVQIVNRTGKEVVIKGYDGEPYVRTSPDGTVEVNLNSPAYYLNEDRFANVTVPKKADAKAAPEWKEVDDTGLFSWHDHRSHYMGLNTPPQVKDESAETKIFDYSIPATVGGKPVKINGTLTWVGDQSGFSIAPLIALVVLIVIGLIGVSIIRRRRDEEDGNDSGEAGPEDDKGPAEAW